ncbi:MAG: histidinol-phosphate transaminase [Phocaeicola sp.]|nr:histidinol-phosphate transaminase [Phocaeicola sp.]
MRDLQALTRPNIWNLKPYSSARNEYSGHVAQVFLDANENPYNAPLNRYPDPLQTELKVEIARRKQVLAEQIFLGNGSDEAIDLVYRCFTNPGEDNVVAIEPTYGMYQVCADINDVEYRPVLLDHDFQLSADRLLAAADNHTTVMWICSPNNPTGNSMNRKEIVRLLESFDGIVVIDEAYGDFSAERSFRLDLNKYPKMIVLNTFSKAWGCAAIRLGMAFADKGIIDLFNKVKYPYNVNLLTQREALSILQRYEQIDEWVDVLLKERSRFIQEFAQLTCCVKVFPTDANFFLARVTDAPAIYSYLVGQGIIVRNRHKVSLCADCLRITIGTKEEVDALLDALRNYQ